MSQAESWKLQFGSKESEAIYLQEAISVDKIIAGRRGDTKKKKKCKNEWK